jgi:hypothetical protein
LNFFTLLWPRPGLFLFGRLICSFVWRRLIDLDCAIGCRVKRARPAGVLIVPGLIKDNVLQIGLAISLDYTGTVNLILN